MITEHIKAIKTPNYKSLFHHTMVDKKEKYRKTNLTNDRKTQIREHT